MNNHNIETPWPGIEPESRARQAHMIAPTPPRQYPIMKIIILSNNIITL